MGVLGPSFTEGEVDRLRQETLPSYLSVFHEMALGRLIPAEGADVVLAGPLATEAASGLLARFAPTHIQVLEPSHAAVVAGLERTSDLEEAIEVEGLAEFPIPFADGRFSHVACLHPLSSTDHRQRLIKESARILLPGGQLVYAGPLRGSFPEVMDMLREFAVKHDQPAFGEAVEFLAQSRPTPETLANELEKLGFIDVDIDVELLSIPFQTGRQFAEGALYRLLLAAELTASLGDDQDVWLQAIQYAQVAFEKYWSDGQFDLTVNIGCATGRRQ